VPTRFALCLVAFVAGVAPAVAQAPESDKWVNPHADSPQRAVRNPPPRTVTSRTIDRTVVVGRIETHTLRAALGALPRTPERIEVVAAEEILPDIRERVRHLCGFVLERSRTIYLRRESAIVREAERSGGPYVLMLAAVIWHEMAHLDGLGEAQARRREEELWTGFVATRTVETTFGLVYLAELRRQK
jgi:hypothetical protein